MDTLIRDIRYAFRRMLKSPGFTGVALLSLALGIGANTAIFTMVDEILFRPLPYRAPERLVEVYPSSDGHVGLAALSYPEFEDIREGAAEVFESVATTSFSIVQENLESGSETLAAEIVSGNWFSTLAIDPVVGRWFSEEESTERNTHAVVVLSEKFWRRRFAGDPGVVGQTMRINRKPYTIIGVSPADLPSLFPGITPDLYAPSMMAKHLYGASGEVLDSRGNNSYFAKARLAEGVTARQAQAVVDRVVADIHETYGEDYPDEWGITLVPTTEVAIHPILDRVLFPAAGVLLALVGVVLLIACVNLASFLLARAADRRKEVALRLALGAGRGTLIRQLVTETVLLALLGGLLGMGLATGLLSFMNSVELPAPVPIDFGIAPDGSVLLFSLVVSLLAGLFFGLIPALQSTNPDVAPTLKDEAGTGATPGRFSLRNVLVVTQVAASLLLLVGSGLFLRSLQAAGSTDPGFGREPTGIAWLGLSAENYDGEAAARFWTELVDDVESIPGVRTAGAVSILALQGTSFTNRSINVPGVEPPAGREGHDVDAVSIEPGYFGAAGVPIVEGRNFGPEDTPEAQRVVIVSRAFVERFFPGREALGQMIFSGDGETEYRIVGVAEDTNVRALGEAPRPYLYAPVQQAQRREMQVLARTAGSSGAVAQRIVELARAKDPDVLVIQTKTMEEHLGFQLFPFLLGGFLLGGLGVLALVLASIGLYGVVNYAVASRTREMGIRMSLGARAGEVIGLVMKGGMGLVAVGAVIGLVLAFVASRAMEGLLFGIEATDPASFVGVTGLLLLVAAAASFIPAFRAGRVDPVRALKSE